jgi:prolyl-tRNA synthetase
VIGDRGLVDSVVEFKGRTDEDSQNVALADIKAKVITAVQAAKNSIQ